MKRSLLLLATTFFSGTLAVAANVRTDYDHKADFANYKTYSWGTVKTENPLDEARVRSAVDADLQKDGWQLKPSGGSATVFVTGNVKNEQQLETMYDGMGGGWGRGWGWGGWGGFGGAWGAGGFGESTTTTVTNRVDNFVLDIFTSSDHKLLFRGVADSNLSNNSGKNTKNLDKDLNDMLNKLPKSAKS